MASAELTNLTGLLAAGRPTPETSDADARAGYDAMGALIPPAAGLAATATQLDGVPGEWVEADRAHADRTVLHLHGGGYVIGSSTSHRSFASHLSHALEARVLVLDYRLAPEHPHPAAVDDALTAYRTLVADEVDPTSLVVTGDSAGGGLALSLLLRLRDEGDPLPVAAGLISPLTDLTVSAPAMAANASSDVVLTPEILRYWADRYRGAVAPEDPRVSPLFADLTGLPPLVVHVSADEILLDDAISLARRARAAGVSVALEVVEAVPHHWHVWAGLIPEGDTAVVRLAHQLRQLLEAAASQE